MKGRPQSANKSGFQSERAASPSGPTSPLKLTIRDLHPEGPRVWQPGIGGEWHLVHIPKKAHFYWGNERMSFLRYMTLVSFRKWNPDWEIHLYRPVQASTVGVTWSTGECYESAIYSGSDHTGSLHDIPGVFLHEVDFSSVPEIAAAPETYKADLFRWHILATVGGVFSDMDILYLRPLAAGTFNTPEHREASTVMCHQEDGHIIGFLGSAPENGFFRNLASESLRHFDPGNYQAIGSVLMNTVYPSVQWIRRHFPGMVFVNLPMAALYPFRWTEVDRIFGRRVPDRIGRSTLGIHWYAGSPIAQEYNQRMDAQSWSSCGNSLTDHLARALEPNAPPLPAPSCTLGEGEGPLFSVVVPAFNHAHFLPETLDSLLAQTWERWEAILVNDGSTDATPEVLEAYAHRDPRFRVVHKTNGGVSTALNAGIHHARGRYICWLSSDDLYEADALATFAEAIQDQPEGEFFHSNYSVLRHERCAKELIPDRRKAEIPSPEFQVIGFFRVNYVNGISICIRRSLFDRAGTFDVRYRNAQDHDLWLRLSALTPFHYVDRRTCITRYHEAAETTSFPEAGLLDSARSCMEFLNRERFPALFPFLDLDSLEGYSQAVRATLEVALDPGSWTYYGTGPVPALLERFGEWIQDGPPELWKAATLEVLKRSLANIAHLPPELRSVIRNLIDGVPVTYHPRDPLHAMDQWAQHLEHSGKHPEAKIIRRYLDRVLPHAHLPVSARPIPPRSPNIGVPPAPQSCEAFTHEVLWRGSEWVEALLAYLTAFQPKDPVRLVLHWDASAAGAPDAQEGQDRVLELIARTGRTRFPDVVLVSAPGEMEATLKDCRRVMEIPRDRHSSGNLSGNLGLRFLAARKALTGNS